MEQVRVELTGTQKDRAYGAVIGMAVGNALGASYAFEPRPAPADVHLRGGGLGPYAAGEWVDDTAMALPLLQVLAAGDDLRWPHSQDVVAARWVQWRTTTKDVAPLVADVLNMYDPEIGARSLRDAAATLHATSGPGSAGNASLMRTTPITLGYLDDPDELAFVARLYSDLTHGNPEAGDACVLWNLAQRHAILHGEFDLGLGVPYIPATRQGLWARLLTQAEVGTPEDFAVRNGWVTQVVQTAWSAINHVQASGPEHLEQALRVAIAAGGDTGTVGAVAGSLLGARWGMSAIPLEWRRQVFGWPGYRDIDLQRDVFGVIEQRPWPARFRPLADSGDSIAAHPVDGGVLLGGVRGLAQIPDTVDAVVSLCRLGTAEELAGVEVAPHNHVRVWLRDSEDAQDNPNLGFVARDAVEMVARLRASGYTVYLHCADGVRRAPFIAALYTAHISDTPAAAAFEQFALALGDECRNPVFERALHQLE